MGGIYAQGGKQRFNAFKKYYDPDIFTAAAKRIRQMARAADKLSIEERIERIAAIFATFRNPDKETVLTPWRVVNMHMSDTIGGYTFFNEDFTENIEDPRFVDRGAVTADVFSPESHLLEINSKSGLYPLYLSYNIYRSRLRNAMFSPETLEEHQAHWDAAVAENIFVICKTPMAKAITRRTLLGFRKGKTNMWAPEDLINKVKKQPELFIKKVSDLIGKTVKINAIVGNPPYQVMDGGAQASSLPVYNYFVSISKLLKPSYLTLIMPARWYAGGRGLDDFRNEMLTDRTIQSLHDYPKASDLFNNVEIKGGLCYFLMNSSYDNSTELVSVTTHSSEGGTHSSLRSLHTDNSSIFVRDGRSISILEKVSCAKGSSFESWISPLRPFGLRGYFINDPNFKSSEEGLNNPIKCVAKGLKYGFVEKKLISQHSEWIDKYKVIMPRANNIGTEANDDNLNVFTASPNIICTESYLCIGANQELTKEVCDNMTRIYEKPFCTLYA